MTRSERATAADQATLERGAAERPGARPPALAETQSIGVVVRTRDPARIAEALRAAVGLTLRGARVRVAGVVPEDRAVATLRALGHEVGVGEERALASDRVEVWT